MRIDSNSLRLFAALVALSFAGSAFAKEPAEAEKDKKKAEETVQTPFGPVRKRPPKEKPKFERRGPSMVDVKIEDGQASFRRKTPFGVQSWTRKLSALSSAEKKLIEEAGKTAELKNAMLKTAATSGGKN